MLNRLRDNFKNKPYLKWVLLVVAASLTLYLGAAFFNDEGQRPADAWAARVNGSAISIDAFNSVASVQDEQMRQIYGEQYDQLRPFLLQQVLNRMVSEEIMVQEAIDAGLNATDAEVAEAILEDPSLQDETGTFVGNERYRAYITRYFPGGVAAYENSRRRAILLRKWRDLVTAAVSVSDREVEEEYRYRNEKTSLRYVVFASADQQVDMNPPESEVRAWYESHPETYTRAEGRRVRWILLDRQAIADALAISDADVEAEYNRNQSTYAHPDQRRASHILLKVEPTATDAYKETVRQRAEGILERARAGEDFAVLASELSEDELSAPAGGDLNFFGRNEMVPEFEQAVFDTPVGELAPVVESPFGFHVVLVTDERGAGVRPLDDVREEIRRSLRARRAQEEIEQRARAIANEAATPDELARVAEREGLELVERVVRRGDRLTELGGGAAALADTLFELEPGSVTGPHGVASGQLIAAVDAVVERQVAPFEDVKLQAKVDMLNERLREVSRERARNELERRGSLERIASANELEIREQLDAIPGDALPGTGGMTPELYDGLFGEDATVGDLGQAPVPAGAVVYEITRRDPFDPAAFAGEAAALREELLAQRQNAVLDAALQSVLEGYEIELNPELLARLRS